MKRIIYLLLLLIIVASCDKSDNEPDKLSWLKGNWKTIKGSPLYEYWERTNDTLYSGIGYRLYGKDTAVSEKLKIYFKNDAVFYVAKVVDQNNGRSIRFKKVNTDYDLLVFENPNHDYPNRITYEKLDNNKIKASITGFQQKNSISVVMKKAN